MTTPFFQYTGTPVPITESTRHLPPEAKKWTSHFVLALLLVVVVWGVVERIRARRNPPREPQCLETKLRGLRVRKPPPLPPRDQEARWRNGNVFDE